MEMIYHRLAYLLILHHRDHMHNMNHKDFLRVVTGFRIKVRFGSVAQKPLKLVEQKSNQFRLEYIRHVKPVTPFSSFLQFVYFTYKQTPFLGGIINMDNL